MPRYNPFRTRNAAVAGTFAGRDAQRNAIAEAFAQARQGDPRSFLLHGEPGIGKSSLLAFAERLAKGAEVAQGDEPFEFLTLAVQLDNRDEFQSIVARVAKSLEGELRKRFGELIKETSQLWDFAQRWDIAGVMYPDGAPPLSDVRTLVDILLECTRAHSEEFEGIFIAIDDADSLSAKAHLGKFCKQFLEGLAQVGCNSVVIGLAGSSSLPDFLRESHSTAPLLFDILELKPLSSEECKAVVLKGLERFEERNMLRISITNEAIHYLAALSNGYPSFFKSWHMRHLRWIQITSSTTTMLISVPLAKTEQCGGLVGNTLKENLPIWARAR